MTSTLVELTDRLALDMVPVPDDADDVCPMCRSWRASGSAWCNNCQQTIDELRAPCHLVIPMCMYSKPSEMRDRLTFYKDGDDEQRDRYAPEVAAIVERFFAEHGGRLEEVTGGWDVACVVPSESRQPPHPLDVALQQLPAMNAPTREILLVRGPGEVGWRKLNDRDAFFPIAEIAGQRVLILEDVYTTGARSQSAASTLALAGAIVPAIVVLARRVNPDWNEGTRALWDRQSVVPFSFTDTPWWA